MSKYCITENFNLKVIHFCGFHIMICAVLAFICLKDSGNSKHSNMESSKNKFHL